MHIDREFCLRVIMYPVSPQGIVECIIGLYYHYCYYEIAKSNALLLTCQFALEEDGGEKKKLNEI